MEIFWNSIAEYNAQTWPFQLAFIALAAVFTLLLENRDESPDGT